MTVGWFWVSFVDPGDGRFLGVAVVDVDQQDVWAAEDVLADTGRSTDDLALVTAAAVSRAWALGCNPGGEAGVAGPLPLALLNEHVPEGFRRRLLTKAEAVAIGGGP